MPRVQAKELDTLTVQDIQEWEQYQENRNAIFIDVVDNENITTERLERIKRLVSEVRQSSTSNAVNADELGSKLLQISPWHSPAPSETDSCPPTPIPDWEEERDLTRDWAFYQHEQLRNMGGCPTREVKHYFSSCQTGEEEVWDALCHWRAEVLYFKGEVDQWLEFRWHQFRTRKDPATFDRYKESVQKHQQEKKIDWTVELQLNRQTKVDEWREYYIFKHRRRRGLEKELERTEKVAARAQEEMRTAERNGSVGLDIDAQKELEEKYFEYLRKLKQSLKEVERAEKSLEAVEGTILIQEANKHLELMQQRLEEVKDDNMERVGKEINRQVMQSRFDGSLRKVGWAKQDLKDRDRHLEWIEEQMANMAAEGAISNWRGFQVYLSTKLHNVQETHAEREKDGFYQRIPKNMFDSHISIAVASKARWGVDFPLDHQGTLKALLAWIEQEFPDLATNTRSYHQPNRDDQLLSEELGRRDQAKVTRYRKKSSQQRSLLNQVRPAKVSKPRQKSRPQGLTNNERHEKLQPHLSSTPRRSKRISERINNSISLSLKPIHASRVCKLSSDTRQNSQQR